MAHRLRPDAPAELAGAAGLRRTEPIRLSHIELYLLLRLWPDPGRGRWLGKATTGNSAPAPHRLDRRHRGHT